jgi:hypothetical protein
MMFFCKFGDGISEREERPYGNNVSANGLQIGEGSANSRTGANDIINDRDPFALDY